MTSMVVRKSPAGSSMPKNLCPLMAMEFLPLESRAAGRQGVPRSGPQDHRIPGSLGSISGNISLRVSDQNVPKCREMSHGDPAGFFTVKPDAAERGKYAETIREE